MFGLDPDISLMDPRNTLRLSEDDGRKNSTVMFGLDPDISLMDLRNTLRLSEDDRRKIIPSFLYFYSFLSFPYLLSLSSFSGLTGESVKEILGSSPRMTKKKSPSSEGLD